MKSLLLVFMIPIVLLFGGLWIALSIDEPHMHVEYSIYYTAPGIAAHTVRIPVWICETDSVEVDLVTGNHFESQISRVILNSNRDR